MRDGVERDQDQMTSTAKRTEAMPQEQSGGSVQNTPPSSKPEAANNAPTAGQAAASTASVDDTVRQSRRRSRWRRRFLMVSVPVLLVAGGGYVWLTGGRFVTTDNAYVHQPLISVAAEVSGRIVAVNVSENEYIAAGAAMFRIDPTPYRIALDQADGALSAARLSVAQLRSTYATAQARLAATEGILEVRTRELARQRLLADQGITAGTAVDGAELAAQSAANGIAIARQALNAAAAALGGDLNIATEDVPAVRAAQAGLASARLGVGQLRSAYATAVVRLDAARSILDVRRREQERQQSLADQGIASASALDQTNLAAQAASNSVHLAEQGVVAAAAALGGDPDIATDDVPAILTAEAGIAMARLAVDQMRVSYATATARLDAALAIGAVRDRELARQRSLSSQGIAAASAVDIATLAARGAENDVALAQQGLDAAIAALGGDPDIAADDVPSVRIALAQHASAELALARTEVVAPVAGVVTQIDSLNIGQFVAPGAMAATLVETEHTWIEANFKETQIAGVTVGHPVEIEVDAYPGLTLHGTVESIGSTTGSVLSLIPAQNATGNWVKVVQRVSVHISVVSDPDHPLRGGMSAHVSVDGGHSRLDDLL